MRKTGGPPGKTRWSHAQDGRSPTQDETRRSSTRPVVPRAGRGGPMRKTGGPTRKTRRSHAQDGRSHTQDETRRSHGQDGWSHTQDEAVPCARQEVPHTQDERVPGARQVVPHARRGGPVRKAGGPTRETRRSHAQGIRSHTQDGRVPCARLAVPHERLAVPRTRQSGPMRTGGPTQAVPNTASTERRRIRFAGSRLVLSTITRGCTVGRGGMARTARRHRETAWEP